MAVWKHAAPTKVRQEGVEPHLTDRGTGQGDVDAPLEACLVQGSIARDTRRAVHGEQLRHVATDANLRSEIQQWLQRWDDWVARPVADRAQRDEHDVRHCHAGNDVVKDGCLLDQWYLDDGLAFMHPQLAVSFLRAFDAQSGSRGAERNLEKTKVTMLMSQSEAESSCQAWQLDELQHLATIEWEPESSITLGSETGSAPAMVSQFLEKTKVVQGMLRRIPWVQDSQAELVLQRACLGVSKVNHLLRANGVELAQDRSSLRNFDAGQTDGLRRLLPGLREPGAKQATLSMQLGGLGMPSVERLAPAAALASLVTALPKVREMARDGERAGLIWARDVEQEHLELLAEAKRMVIETIGDDNQEALESLLRNAGARAAEDWQCVKQGRPSPTRQAPRAGDGQDLPERRGIAARAGIGPASGHLRADPDELGRPLFANKASTPHLQRELSILLDVRQLEDVAEMWDSTDDRGARRLQELLDPSVSHDWLWVLDSRHGSRLCEEDFLLDLGSRLGADIVPPDTRCR
eukprot:293267-Karenia_brevis.AAC.1